MKKLMMLLIAMVNIFAFTSCNNEVADGTDDYTPSPDKDWFMPSINDVPGMLEGKCFRANEDGFKAYLESDEAVNYPNFSITFKKNSILILTDDNDLDNQIILNPFHDIQYVEESHYSEGYGGEIRSTYIEYNFNDETYRIQLAFFGKKDNFCLGILFGNYCERIGFSTGSLNYLYEVPLTDNDIDVLFNDLHKNYLIKTTVEKLNSISDAYVLIEEVGGDDKNMYSYGIFKINSEKRIQELYYITSVEHESVTKLNNVSEKYFWVKRNFSEDNLQSDDSSFPVTEEQLKLWTSYCILTSEIYKKYSDILPTGLF